MGAEGLLGRHGFCIRCPVVLQIRSLLPCFLVGSCGDYSLPAFLPNPLPSLTSVSGRSPEEIPDSGEPWLIL